MTEPDSRTRAEPYVLRQGEGPAHLVAGQVIRTLAGTKETAGGFGAVVAECPADRGPIPMHWHEREHDTWYATRGKLQVWCGDQSRVLRPGDFAYVRPGDHHSYQSIAPRTQFFGVVAPGGWEGFFADAGEVWGMTALPPDGRPFDFSKMGPAMGKYRIMRVEDPTFAQASDFSDADRDAPEDHRSFFLEEGHGKRHHLLGHLSTTLLNSAQSDGKIDMRVIEGGRDAAIPSLSHRDTHVFLYMLDGSVSLTLDGEEHRLAAGDAANIPAETTYASKVLSGSARWLVTSANGNGGLLWDRAGSPTDAFSRSLEEDNIGGDRLESLSDVDVVLA